MTDIQPQIDLIDECRRGSREAMHALYTANQRRVYSVALNFFGGDMDKASDITQQVFLKLFRGTSFRGDAEITTWLYRVTVNACIDETRRAGRLFGLAEWLPGREPTSRPAVDERIQSREIASEVRAALSSLKPKYRVPLVLKYIEELSYQEIADVLECSIGTISSRISRGHRTLAKKLAHLKSEVR